jgi:biotin carboxyl carrier protein
VQYVADVNGRLRQVAVSRVGSSWHVIIDQRTWRVDAARVDAHTLSILGADGAPISREVTVALDPATGQLGVRVGTTPVFVGLRVRRPSRRNDEAEASRSGPQQVVAPMPGKIVRVLVTGGESVRARQGLVVVEAMKMENELRAGRDGTVSEIRVREGESVEAGAPLLIIT